MNLPSGRPLLLAVEGQRLLLLDEAGDPAPIVGEIVIESPHVTPGQSSASRSA